MRPLIPAAAFLNSAVACASQFYSYTSCECKLQNLDALLITVEVWTGSFPVRHAHSRRRAIMRFGSEPDRDTFTERKETRASSFGRYDRKYNCVLYKYKFKVSFWSLRKNGSLDVIRSWEMVLLEISSL